MARDTLARYTAPPDVPKTPFVPTFVSLIQPLLWFVRGWAEPDDGHGAIRSRPAAGCGAVSRGCNRSRAPA
jgi:hypothetical protein